MTEDRLTSTEVTYMLVEAKAVGRLTVTEHGDYVRVTGPKDDRTRAFRVLFDHGLTISPYGDHDDYSRQPDRTLGP
jgi:hypothetical protein